MMNEHLILAGKYSRTAHNNWLVAMRESTSDDVRADAMRAGDSAIDLADKHLREYGVGLDDITDDEREMLLTDECFNSSNVNSSPAVSDEPELDFKPLERSYKLSLVVKAVNRIIFISLVAGFAYMMGYGDGRDAGAYPTGEQFQQQLQQLGGK